MVIIRRTNLLTFLNFKKHIPFACIPGIFSICYTNHEMCGQVANKQITRVVIQSIVYKEEIPYSKNTPQKQWSWNGNNRL